MTPTKLQTRIGLYNKHFQMESADITESFDRPVGSRKWPAYFELSMGKMVWDDPEHGQTYDTTFILEIHYKGSYDAHSARLGAASFGSHLYADFEEVVHPIALEFIERQGLVLSYHHNSWPQFQATVFKPQPQLCRPDGGRDGSGMLM